MKISEETSETAASIEDVFQAEETPLLHYAYGLVKRREVAEDVVQEAFMRLHQHWEGVDQPRPWLYRAVRNLALNHLRKHKRETLSDENEGEESEETPDSNTGRLEAMSAVRFAMAELGHDDRELIRLKYEENLSYQKIGEKTGLGIGNVGYRLHHLLKGMAEALRKSGVEGSRG